MPGEVVSFPQEPLILVDENDQEVGYASKREVHQGEGILHRAFSIFLFNTAGEVLLQQRAQEKPLWPGYWSNSCCSHPRKGEEVHAAARRRLKQELGLESDFRYLYKFQYFAPFGDKGAERELCWVYAGIEDREPTVNPTEVAATRYVAPQKLDEEMRNNPEQFTPWFHLEWKRIRTEYYEELIGARATAQKIAP